MKYLTYFIVGLLLSSSLFILVKGEESDTLEENIAINFSIPDINLIENFINIDIQGTNIKHYVAGQPILPIYTKTLEFPFGTKIINAEIKTNQINNMLLDKKVIPAPNEIISADEKSDIAYIVNDQIYTNDEIFPNKWMYYYSGTGINEDNARKTFLTIRVYPVRYNAKSDIIYYTDKIDIKIDYKLPDKNPFPLNGVYDLLIITPKNFLNLANKLSEHKQNIGIKTTVKTLSYIYDSYSGNDKPEQIKYFIKDAIENWGISYVLLIGGLKSIVYGQPRDNLNEGTRDWYLPVRYANLWDNGSIYDPGFISDLYYADIYDGQGGFSNWDSNGDGVYGGWAAPPYQKELEYDLPDNPNYIENKDDIDIIDLYPDIYLGRIPCRNIFELEIVVDKIIEYEKSSASPLWFNKMISIGGDPYNDVGTDILEGEEISEKAISYMENFEHIKLFASNKDTFPKYTPLKRNIIREISDGCGFVLFDGHGGPSWWNTYWPFSFNNLILFGGLENKNMLLLNNKQKLPVCIIGGCHCSQFNVSLIYTLMDKDNSKSTWSDGKPISECFGWRLVKKINGGAIATIGSTGLGYEAGGENGDLDGDGTNDPDCVEALGGYLETQFFRLYGEENNRILGQTWCGAINQYLDIYPGMVNRTYAKTVEQWVLIGDPSLRIGGYP